MSGATHGAWARWLIGALVDDDLAHSSDRARDLARDGRVHNLSIVRGEITARVVGAGGRECDVVVSARPLPARVWAAFVEGAAGRPEVEGGVAGREQSVHVQHELAADWGEPLIPRGKSVRSSCTCSHREPGTRCHHVSAVGYAAAAAIDADPSLVLRWRGVEPVEPGGAPQPLAETPVQEDAWTAGPLPDLGKPRALPAGAVLMRLGPSGVNAGGRDLAELLQEAYERFAR
jgi:uncharacterized Zn finger protein